MLELLRSTVYFLLKILFSIYFFIFGQPKFNKNAKKVMQLYNTGDFTGWFKKIRFWDAPYLEVEKLIPKKGIIVELGCGEGMFSNYMAVSSSKRKIFGFDLDRKRIKEADRGLKNVVFKEGDATKINIPKSDAIVMFHFLHHLTSKISQEKLIKKCIRVLSKNGKLVIIEIDDKPFLKYLLTYAVDHFLVAWLFERKLHEPKIFFRNESQWVTLLEENNLKCKVTHVTKGKPFSHIIFDCSKIQTR